MLRVGRSGATTGIITILGVALLIFALSTNTVQGVTQTIVNAFAYGFSVVGHI